MPDVDQEEVVGTEPEAVDQDPESAPDNKAAGEGEGERGGSGKTVPLKTFIETRRNAQEAKAALDWYRTNVGDPKDVQKYIEWKQAQANGGNGEPAPLDAERRKNVDWLMRQASPKVFEAAEKFEQFQKEREELMIGYAEETMPELAKEFGLSTKASAVNRMGAHIALEIKEDPALMRRWQLGDTSVLRIALKRYLDDYLDVVRPGPKAATGDLATKRAISKLPTPPAGGTSTSAGAKPRAEGDRGLTKQADKEAFALLQAHMRKE